MTKPRIGFAFSTKERVELSQRSLRSIDADSGFDLVWIDGSESAGARALPDSVKLQNCRLVEVHRDVRGGPDAAIRYGLRRLLSLGYDYCGLIENDIEFQPGWLGKLMAAFELATRDGLVVGAATARNVESRILHLQRNYSLNWNMGAGMVLFTRTAVENVLADYGKVTSSEVSKFYDRHFQKPLKDVWELWMDKPDRPLGMDWKFAISLYKAGLASVGTVPSMAGNIDLDMEVQSRTRYITEATAATKSGDPAELPHWRSLIAACGSQGLVSSDRVQQLQQLVAEDSVKFRKLQQLAKWKWLPPLNHFRGKLARALSQTIPG